MNSWVEVQPQFGFKVFVLMKVLLHRHHPSAEITELSFSHLPHAGCDPEHPMPKAALKLAAAPTEYATSEHLENSSGRASCQIESIVAAVSIPDSGGHP